MVIVKEEIGKIFSENSEVLKEKGVKRIGLFGSFIHEKQTPESDVDIIVEFEPGQKSIDRFMELAEFLEQKLERPVDLLTLESLGPYIGPEILSEVQYFAISA